MIPAVWNLYRMLHLCLFWTPFGIITVFPSYCMARPSVTQLKIKSPSKKSPSKNKDFVLEYILIHDHIYHNHFANLDTLNHDNSCPALRDCEAVGAAMEKKELHWSPEDYKLLVYAHTNKKKTQQDICSAYKTNCRTENLFNSHERYAKNKIKNYHGQLLLFVFKQPPLRTVIDKELRDLDLRKKDAALSFRSTLLSSSASVMSQKCIRTLKPELRSWLQSLRSQPHTWTVKPLSIGHQSLHTDSASHPVHSASSSAPSKR